jgi:hypothetical protein
VRAASALAAYNDATEIVADVRERVLRSLVARQRDLGVHEHSLSYEDVGVFRLLVPSKMHRQAEAAPAGLTSQRRGRRNRWRVLVGLRTEEPPNGLHPFFGDASARDARQPRLFTFLSREFLRQFHGESSIPDSAPGLGRLSSTRRFAPHG